VSPQVSTGLYQINNGGPRQPRGVSRRAFGGLLPPLWSRLRFVDFRSWRHGAQWSLSSVNVCAGGRVGALAPARVVVWRRHARAGRRVGALTPPPAVAERSYEAVSRRPRTLSSCFSSPRRRLRASRRGATLRGDEAVVRGRYRPAATQHAGSAPAAGDLVGRRSGLLEFIRPLAGPGQQVSGVAAGQQGPFIRSTTADRETASC
jgi:hypothetical protein